MFVRSWATPSAVICICMLRTASSNSRNALTHLYQRFMEEERKKPSNRPTNTFRNVPIFSTFSGATRAEWGIKTITTATVQESKIAHPIHLQSEPLSQAQPVTIPKTAQDVILVIS